MVKDGWKRYSTAEIGTFAKGSGISREQSNSGNLPAVRYGELYTTHNYYIREFASHISSDVAMQAHKIGYGDLLFTCSGETKEEIGKCVAVVTNTEAYAGGDLIIITPTCKMHPLFMGYALNTPQVIHQRAQLAQGDSIVHISTESIKSLEFDAPEYPEQCRIAEALSDIDELILNIEKTIKKYQAIKQACLQRMFPQNGQSEPEIRLPGFTGAWEQRELGEYCDMFNGDRSNKYPNAQDMVSEGIPFINAGDLENGRVNLKTANKISREKYDDLGGAELQLGDIVYCLRGTLGKNAYIDNFEEGTVASSLVAIRPKNINGRYLFHVLNSDIEYRQRILHDEGAAQPNLSAKNVAGFNIPIPHIDEQDKLASYFDHLDRLITLHQRKLKKYRDIKQGLMDELLTGRIRI